jgi:Protein of unknown function (DUF3263)
MKVSGTDDLVAVPAQEQRAQPATDEPPAADGPAAAEPATAEPAAATDEPALDEREREILAFERKWWKHAGSKEQAIRDAFDLSATRYYQILNGLLDNPAALAHDPVLVGRLRRLRSARARSRTAR